MVIFFPILFFCLADVILSKFNKAVNISYIDFNNDYFRLYQYNFTKNIKLVEEETISKKDILDFLNEIKKDPDTVYAFIQLVKKSDYTINFILDYLNKTLISIDNPDLYNVISYIVIDILKNDSNTFIDSFFNIIKNETSKNIIDCIINIIVDFEPTYDFMFKHLKQIFVIESFHNLFKDFYDRYKKEIIEILDIALSKTKFAELFHMLKEKIIEFEDILFDLAYKLIKNYNDRKGLAKVFKDFFTEINDKNNTAFLGSLSSVLNNSTITREISKVIVLDNPISNKVMQQILCNEQLMNFLGKFLYNLTFVTDLADIVEGLDNITYVNENVPKFIQSLYKNNIGYLDFLINITRTIVLNVLTETDLRKFITKIMGNAIKSIVFGKENKYDNISQSCLNLLEYTFIDINVDYNKQNKTDKKNNKNEKNKKKSDNSTNNNSSDDYPYEDNANALDFRYFYFKKIFIDTTKNKNDFLTYENCINRKYNDKYAEKYNITPIYLIGIINDEHDKKILKKTIYFEKYNYLISLCLPYGINNSIEMCSKNDYNNVIKVLSEISTNMENSNIESLILDAETLRIKPIDYVYFCIIIFIISFPIIIKLFLSIYETIKRKNYVRSSIVNKLTIDKKDKDKNNDDNNSNKIIKKETKRSNSFLYIAPRWYILLNEYFDIIKNGRELFNFSLNATNFNDFNGISYIKGVLGLSMLLNIFGQTYFILSNIPTKELDTYQYYETFLTPLYIIIFIGLRYCPRIIFSCSGYTLVYKFLCFIEHDGNYCFFKFLILQSYKYILLILIVLFLRFAIYYTDVIFRKIKSPNFEFFHFVLTQNNKNFFYYLFSFLFYGINSDDSKINELNIMHYLYMPINEVFLFIFGISLISIGFKFKIRIDIIIITFVLLIYLIKILISLSLMNNMQIYPFLYFYVYGYGRIMLSPLYNLPSFMIGMYFGLVNYTIQKGVNNVYKENYYTKIELCDPINRVKSDVEKKVDCLSINNESDIHNNYNFDNKFENIKRVPTYNIGNHKLSQNQDNLKEEDDKSFDDEYKGDKSKDDYNILEEDIDKTVSFAFLRSAVSFTDFHRRNQDKICLKIVLIIFIIIFLFFISIQYIFIYIFITRKKDTSTNITETLSFDTIIPNNFLNIVYILDIDLVVIMVNWAFFFLYFKGGQINDFMNNHIWTFFIKSYFSYSLVLSPVILYIFYQSETVITVTISDIFLYSFINTIFVFISVVLFYSCYEYPLKKIFKTLKIRNTYTNIEYDYLDLDESELIK